MERNGRSTGRGNLTAAKPDGAIASGTAQRTLTNHLADEQTHAVKMADHARGILHTLREKLGLPSPVPPGPTTTQPTPPPGLEGIAGALTTAHDDLGAQLQQIGDLVHGRL